MEKVAIIAAKRSAIGSFGGSLSQIKAADLGAQILTQVLQTAEIEPEQIDELILGNVLSAGQGQNLARQIALAAGLPMTSSAFAINKVCGSGLKSVILAAQSILLGENDLVIAGGLELMSQAPYLDKTSRFGSKLGYHRLEDSLLTDGLWDPMEDIHMGMTAETIAKQYQLTRSELDSFALASHQKALDAQQSGAFMDEIVPIKISSPKGDLVFDQDQHPRQTDMDQLSQLKPAFQKEGLCTAGNSSGINDGAAFLLLASEAKVAQLGLKPLAFIEGWATSGLDPKIMGLGPVPATHKLLTKLSKSMTDVDLLELNEAFAAQAIAVIKELGIDPDKVNKNGGAIALGHPIGASGARILVTLLHQLKNQSGQLGVASLCIGGGQGISLAISN